MTEEQKAKVDLLKTLFLDGAISSAEFEKRKKEILDAVPVQEIAVPAPQKIIEEESNPLPLWVFGIGLLIISLIIIISSVQNGRQKTAPEKKEPTPEQQASILKRDREAAIKREAAEKERREKEAYEEKLFLKTKAGRIWKKHPEWSKDDCVTLSQNMVWVGMEYAMLKYLKGSPDSANPSNYGNGTSWQYCWHGHTPSCFYDNDGDGDIDAYN